MLKTTLWETEHLKHLYGGSNKGWLCWEWLHCICSCCAWDTVGNIQSTQGDSELYCQQDISCAVLNLQILPACEHFFTPSHVHSCLLSFSLSICGSGFYVCTDHLESGWRAPYLHPFITTGPPSAAQLVSGLQWTVEVYICVIIHMNICSAEQHCIHSL